VQIATDAKSTEITAVPELLEMLLLKGTIVTTDALMRGRDPTDGGRSSDKWTLTSFCAYWKRALAIYQQPKFLSGDTDVLYINIGFWEGDGWPALATAAGV
jgi:hypothetical protein